MSTSPKHAVPSRLAIAQVCAMALLIGMSLASPGSAQTDCWKHTVSLCDLVVKYGIQYSGGTCPGFYDVSFVFKASSGTCGGAIKTGQHIKFTTTTPHNALLVTLMNAMGVPDQQFGDPQWGTGPLAGVAV